MSLAWSLFPLCRTRCHENVAEKGEERTACEDYLPVGIFSKSTWETCRAILHLRSGNELGLHYRIVGGF